MDHELLEQLTDAGWGKNADGSINDDYCPPDLGCCEPTLEELIEACGDKFYGLRLFKKKWEASAKGAQVQNLTSPIEAVARLWLALNKK